MVASFSARNNVNHSIDNCTVFLLFNTLALVHLAVYMSSS